MAQSRRTEGGLRMSCVKVAENRASMSSASTLWTILSLDVLCEARSMICKAWVQSPELETLIIIIISYDALI